MSSFPGIYFLPASYADVTISGGVRYDDYTGAQGLVHVTFTTAASDFSFSGIAAMADGETLLITNGTTHTITLNNNDSNSLAANRFFCQGNVNYTVSSGASVLLKYFGSITGWRPILKS